MSDWTSGYVADIGYTFGYYPELNPLRVKLAFLNSGLASPEMGTACELGFGQGMSANLHAAASAMQWAGTDFNPAQAGFAQELAAASGSNARLYDEAFADFANRADLPDFDYIGIHGIWSWISDENRTVMVDFIRKKLKVGGVLSNTGGERFFDEDGEPSKALAGVLAFYTQAANNRKSTLHVCAVLQKHNVIQPWPIKVKGAEGAPAGEQTIEGLFRIDEAAMNRLPAEAYLELRDSGALILAFCQLLSMQHLPLLGQLADAHAKAAPPLPVAGKDLDLSFMSDGDTISFSWTG